jgi:hypothetical protein
MVNTWKIVLATVVIFGAGVFAGGLLVSHAERARLRSWRPHVAPAPPPQWTPPLREFPRRAEKDLQLNLEQRRMEFLLSVTRELGLSPDQRARIERLIRESQERTRRLWEQVGPQMRKELVEVKEKIREELTSQQRRRFEELMKWQQARRPEDAQPAASRLRDQRRLNAPRELPRPEGPLPEDAPQPPPPSEPPRAPAPDNP